MPGVHVVADPTNAAQLSAWDGAEGAYWAGHAERFERATAGYDARFFEVSAIASTDHVLDVGCGTGGTTRAAGRAAPSGSALGVDLSSRMIEYATRRAAEEGLANVRFAQADAQIHPFEPDAFDVAISRMGAMFFGDPVAAFSNVRRALRPEGRLVLLVWRSPRENEWIREIRSSLAAGRDLPVPSPDAPGPFSLADPGRARDILEKAGFSDVALEATTAPIWFGEDAYDAEAFLIGLTSWMLDGLDDDGRARARHALRTSLGRHETSDGVVYGSAAWLIAAGR
jgi:SAM-dependent methyltransferase